MSYYSRTPVGETMSRITSDVDAVNSIFSSGLINALIDFIKVFGIVAAMYVISPTLCFIALVAIPAVVLVSDFFRRGIYKSQMLVRKAVGNINTFLQEVFNGIKIVKSYGKEEQYNEAFQKPLIAHLEAINLSAVYDSYFPCVMQVIRAVIIVIILWIGARTGVNNRVAISIGGLAAMADLVTRLYGPVESISQQFQTIQQALAGLRRIVELLAEKPEEKGTLQHISAGDNIWKSDTTVEIKNVSFGYNPDKTIVKDVSMGISQGKRIAVVGRTGAGKTSLLNLVAGLYKPEKGTIDILGFDPYLLDAMDRRKLIGVVPQNVHIFEGSIRENITLRDQSLSQTEIEEAAKKVGLHDYIMSLDKNYDTLLGTEGMKLSFGQSQLLSLARAIVTNPPVLLLDEPTSGMDAVTEAKVFQAFRAAGEHRTIITISHRLSGIIDADEIYFMSYGKIVQSGSPDSLAGQKGWYSVFKQLEDVGWKLD
jgi:ATP-binding cassette subfamily B protein